ncbi:putative transglycosylase-associated protein [Desulfosarcina variabilis str. Montpellier]|uniref:GlsB/YeaQ/YmgE family stress response membrane protein n=1 Tax=Desulfosarcina variabilis TaxID=2300 RepID=UPI003AFB79DF
MEYIWMILIGMTAGWLAGQLITGKDFGVTVDIITGMVGALIGGLVFERINLFADNSLIGSLLVATGGAITFLYGIRVLKKA